MCFSQWILTRLSLREISFPSTTCTLREDFGFSSSLLVVKIVYNLLENLETKLDSEKIALVSIRLRTRCHRLAFPNLPNGFYFASWAKSEGAKETFQNFCGKFFFWIIHFSCFQFRINFVQFRR